ncbi:unnamed protein product (macronuclear) [Paramecium tetraurelia]|uniref:RING-type domain-containing protein n=1 Tax=Paramecium tetraurelia TaxID=5888 RepID=A0CKX3_PARTE|nr:uncharacterized protein GSPATT00007987001 [Paramecium tetraurelia]CAK71440.1 unnamed protein product [Paramecium tetraurelia]|eukprot:XP_001438837.1 hypothetical protein (macronuclear) [Paramecium tetraurelia strain d4-2]
MKFILQCSICLQSLCNPMSLSCGHTFCHNCIHNTLDKQEQSVCPLCRQPVLISQNKSDELLSIVQQIYEKDGIEELLNEFPSLIICLCCGLTPINPIVLPCQHMFCQKCIYESLQEELLCPVCSEFSFSLKVSINQKYKDLINWYLKQFQIEEVQQTEEIMGLDNVNGLPIFNFDQTVIVHMETQFTFFELRYQEMIRRVCSGSCNFIVSGDFIYGDLVKIKNIKKINKGYQVLVEAIARVKIKSVYNYINGIKTSYQPQNAQSFWLCSYQHVKDQILKENSIQQYNNIVLTLDEIYRNIKSDLHSLFDSFMKKLHLVSSADSSLILLATLNNQTISQYYDVDVEKRIQLIQNHFCTLEQHIKGMYNQGEQKQSAKYQQQTIEIILYPEYDVATQYFLNLFNLNKVLCF